MHDSLKCGWKFVDPCCLPYPDLWGPFLILDRIEFSSYYTTIHLHLKHAVQISFYKEFRNQQFNKFLGVVNGDMFAVFRTPRGQT